jgi:Fe/S biogenesis protein NfuA
MMGCLMSDQAEDPIFTVTPKARRRVLEIKASEPDGDTLALWIEIIGQRGPDYAYDLYFQSADEADPGDEVLRFGGDDGAELTVVIPSDSVDALRGATLDMSRDLLNPGMVVNNPNRPARPPGPASPQIEKLSPDELTGTVEEKITTVLERVINPSIASHGGRAELVAVEEGETAYLRLMGGCVGCGMAAVTLSQGIEVAIRESVPEITRVVDVTDHASGTNPYYEAAKK